MNAGWHRIAAATALSLLTPLALSGQNTPPPAGSFDTPILLRLAPPEGQVSRYTLSAQVDVDSPMTPSSGPVMTMRMHQTQTVLGVEEDLIRFRATIDSATTTSAMPGMPVPDLSGSVFTTEFDTRNQVLEVTVVEGRDAADLDPESLFQSSAHFVLPEDEVSPGDTWTRNVPINLPAGPSGSASTEVAMRYTFVSLEGSLATLSFEGPLDMDLDMAGMAVSGTGTITGAMVVDLAAGRFMSQSSRTSLDMNVAGMTMNSTTTTTMELIPDP